MPNRREARKNRPLRFTPPSAADSQVTQDPAVTAVPTLRPARIVFGHQQTAPSDAARQATSTVDIPRNPLLSRAQLRATPGVPPGVVSLALTSVLEIAVAVSSSILNIGMPSPTAAPPRVRLNGYSLVPSSTEDVTSFYGPWTYLPGAPSLVQGQQHFDIVDPRTHTSVGDFDALVGRGNGYNYTSLLVTANGGTNIGTGAGQVPPVGSLIAQFKIGPLGWVYSSMPTTSGDVLSFALATPFGDIPLRTTFDGSAGIADHTFDDRPVRLTNGYSIAPADPLAETITATSGILPLYTSIQGRQLFGVYDSAGAQVGTFEGVFTTTSDILGTYTQAILVTGNDGVNVGTAAGQTPPVGSVFNAVYAGNDDNYVLYTSLPSSAGDVVTVEQVSPDGVRTSSRTFLDASEPPSNQPISAARGLTFVPVSAFVPSGINGLPPREVQYQGHQQFDVVDASGAVLGRIDAAVATQRDLFGIRSQAILVTDVTGGAEGTGLPPVGSGFSMVTFGDGRFGTVQAVTPTPTRDVKTFAFVTPLGSIPVFYARTRVAHRIDVSFADPFV